MWLGLFLAKNCLERQRINGRISAFMSHTTYIAIITGHDQRIPSCQSEENEGFSYCLLA